MRNIIKTTLTGLILSLSLATLVYAKETPPINSAPADNEWSDEESISSTDRDSTNCCQITYQCKMPQGFNLASYVTFYNTDTEDMYRLIATSGNEYSSRMYVPEGNYEISECAVLNDATNKYPMVKPADFSVKASDFYLIESTLVDYKGIEEEANKRLSGKKEQSVKSESKQIETKEEVTNTLPWRTFKHSGKGPDIVLTGTSQVVSDIIIKITKTGAAKVGEFQYSTDNGQSWSKTSIIKSTKLNTTDGSDLPTGLSIEFSTSSDYLKNDVYTYHSELEYSLEALAPIGNGQIRMTSIDTPYDYNTGFAVRIEKSGDCGEAMFSYTFDYSDNANAIINYSAEHLVPANGLYHIPDTPFVLTFWDGLGEFRVGDKYTVNLKTESSPKDFAPYIIGMIFFVGIISSTIIYYLLSLKEKPDDYVIMPYEKIVIRKKTKNK